MPSLSYIDKLKHQLQKQYSQRNDDITLAIKIREQDWPKSFPLDSDKAHPWIQVNRRFHNLVKPVFSAIADESMARIEAAVGLGLPMPQEHYFREEGVKDKPLRQAWLRAMQIRLDRQLGVSQYGRSVYNILTMGRSSRISHPSIHAVDFYLEELIEEAEKGGLSEEEIALKAANKPPFINQELDPRTVYCYPNEWEPQVVLIVERRPIYDVCFEYDVDINTEGMRRLGPAEYPEMKGMTATDTVEVTTYWDGEEVCHYLNNQTGLRDRSREAGLMVESEPIKHGYGEILERVGAPGKVPIFNAPGLMRGWGTTREAMPLILEIASVLSAYDSALTMSMAYAMSSIPRMYLRNNEIGRGDAEAAEIAPTDEELEGDLVQTYRNEEFGMINQQLPIEALEKVKDQLRQQIDEFFVGYVMRGTPQGSLSNVSGNVVAKMQVAAVAPFLQLSHNLDERDSSIFRFWLGCVESLFKQKTYVWDSEEGKALGLKPEDVKGDYLVQATSDTGLPDSRLIDEEITAKRVEQGFELPSALLEIRGHRDMETFVERLLEQRAMWLYADRQTQVMVEEAIQRSQPEGAGPAQVGTPAPSLPAVPPSIIYGPNGQPLGLGGPPQQAPPPQGAGGGGGGGNGVPPNADDLVGMDSNAGPGGNVRMAIAREFQEALRARGAA